MCVGWVWSGLEGRRRIERMFATDFAGCDAAQTLALVAAAHEQQRRSELDLILLAQHYAGLHPAPARVRGGVPGAEQGRVYGGEGCPEMGEFAVAEFGAVVGRSAGSAAMFIGQAVALKCRFPRTWDRVRAGDATGWKALQLVQDCVALSLEAAAIVDRRVADIVDSVTFAQLRKIIKAAIWQADPEAAKAKAEEKAKERGVWVGRTDDHGTTTLFVKAATGDVVQLDATITQLANALAALGDTGSLDQRRAKAAGLLSDPDLAADLLAAAHHLATTQPTGSPADADPVADGPTPHDDPEPPMPAASEATGRTDPDRHTDRHTGDESLLDDLAEPDPDDEADRDTPHPNTPNHPLDHDHDHPLDHDHPVDHDRPLPTPGDPPADNATSAAALAGGERGVGLCRPAEPPGQRPSTLHRAPGPGQSPDPVHDPARAGLDAAARRELRRKIDATRRHHPDRRRTYQTVVTVHITDQTLLTGSGVARVEGYGPVYTDQLAELLGHHRIVIRPVIDLNQAISVHAYEIPDRIRDHTTQRYPVEQFPYGTGETTHSTDLDHIQPYQPGSPSNQTHTDNLNPLRRYSHRLKTHGDWNVRRINHHTLEWTSPHGYQFHLDHNGTHPIRDRNRQPQTQPKPPRRHTSDGQT